MNTLYERGYTPENTPGYTPEELEKLNRRLNDVLGWYASPDCVNRVAAGLLKKYNKEK